MNKKLLSLISVLLLLSIVFSSCKSKEEDEESSGSSSSKTSSNSSKSEPDVSSQSQSSPSDEEIPTDAKPIEGANVDLNKINALENKPKGWGQGTIVDKNNRPTSCDSFQKKYGEYNSIFIGEDTEKVIYLTFDEGYENGYTAKILDTLKEKKCPAVFFVTMDYVKNNEDLVKRMIEEGHVVGNHSTHHPSMPKVSVQKAIDEIVVLHNYVLEKFNYTMSLFRPPMGEWSTQTLEITKQLGYKTVFWSFAYKDWETDKQMGIEKAFPKVTNAIHNGAVYLLHAVSKDNTEMLGDVIDNIRGKGFSFEKLN